MRSLMLGENEVSFSTPPISCAVASSALRSTSSVIGSNVCVGGRGSSSPALHQQRAVGVNAGAIAGIEHRGRRQLLDHGRSFDDVVGEQPGAVEDAGRHPASGLAGRVALEVDVARG